MKIAEKDDVIVLSNLTKVYGDTPAVDSLNFSVKKGEIFGFLGLNGAGKTTAIRMVLGMVKPTKGTCYLLGKDVKAGNQLMWKEIGYMVESPYAYPELTVRENLNIFTKLREIDDKKSINRVMEILNIEDYADVKANHLSLGNAQRLGIAKALIHQPSILILDEPTNGLDPAGIVEIRELLQTLSAEGVTTLVSSHNLDEISRIATKVAIIHKGRLLKEFDTHQLELQLKRSLQVDGLQKERIKNILAEAGYHVSSQSIEEETFLEISDNNAVVNPDRIASLLVKKGCPPTHLLVKKESLESYFLRLINESEKNSHE